MKHVKLVEFVFENCESFEIESKYFGGFQMDNITTSIARIACNSISKMQTVHTVVFEIFGEANVQYSAFGGAEKEYKLHRISEWNDITQLTLHYDDGTKENFFVDYDDGGNDGLGAENKNQKSYISAPGNLYLVIEKDKDVFDYFDKDEVNNEESVESIRRMIMD